MDKTLELASGNGAAMVTEALALTGMHPKAHAKWAILSEYKDVEYIEETDSYALNGYQFDYFAAGVSLGGKEATSISYLLVDKEFPRVWYSGDWDSFIRSRDRETQFRFEMDQYNKTESQEESLAGILLLSASIALIIACFITFLK